MGKKLLVLVMTISMVLAMTCVSFATSTTPHTITIDDSKDGHVYEAYQIFKGDITGGKLTNVEWGTGVDGDALLTELQKQAEYAACESAEDVAEVLASVANDSSQLDAFAKLAGQFKAASPGTSTELKAPYTVEVTGDGYYMVMDKDGTVPEGQDAATKYIVKVVDDVNVSVKSDIPDIDKVIVKGTEKVKGDSGNIGDTVTFNVTSKVPAMDGYDKYDYVVYDTMSAGLTPLDYVKVTIDEKEYTDFTAEVEGQKITVTFNNFIAQKAYAGKEIVITYKGKINNEALVTDKEENTVYLKYSNNPNDDSKKGTTPEKKVYVYDFDINIDKWAAGDNSTEVKLLGAKFVLKNAEGKFYRVDETSKAVTWVDDQKDATEVTTDDKGAASFKGIAAGTYYLTETKAPEGYNKLKADVEVTITATYDKDGNITTSATKTGDGQYYQEAKVENKTGFVLPSTGGMGTKIFYGLGALLVLVAAIMIVARRRADEEA